jgi:uncharacterized membrane protein
MLWMTAFHFAFDLNHFGWIHQDMLRDPVWTVQRTCILSLFLWCAGWGQALAVAAGQTWGQFARRWLQIAGCAALVSVGSAQMFPQTWIYFGVLHGMAVMLLICRLTAHWGRGLWWAGGAVVLLGLLAQDLHTAWQPLQVLNHAPWNVLGLISQKPITEDYVPLLPWLGVMWWGMAAGQWMLARQNTNAYAQVPEVARSAQHSVVRVLAPLGRWSLSWYMLHQPLLMGLLMLLAV